MIEAVNLTKSFDHQTVVNKVNLSVPRGSIYGFIGLNGAGKTTTIRMLLGMIRPSSGSCLLLGEKIGTNSYHIWKKVGYMVETPSAYPELTVRENIRIYRDLQTLSGETCVSNIIEKLGLTPYEHTKSKHLSLGNKQRLGLAKALIHSPEILILDEPVNGLDPAGILEIRTLLQDLSKQGTTILLSSHLLEEVAKIATRIGMIHQGQLVREIDTRMLISELDTKLIIRTSQITETYKFLSQHRIDCTMQNKELWIYDNSIVGNPGYAASMIVQAGYELTHLEVKKESLEEYFLRTIGEK